VNQIRQIEKARLERMEQDATVMDHTRWSRLIAALWWLVLETRTCCARGPLAEMKDRRAVARYDVS